MKRASLLLTCLVAGALLFTGLAQAQTLGKIQGFVTDEQNAALPGVTVLATNQETGAERTAYTDAAGFYGVSSLVPGYYSILASLEGMQPVQQQNIRLFAGQVVDANLSMAVGAVTEAIVVTAETPLLEVSRTSAASYVGEDEIEKYPILGRDFKQFALLTPTVQNDSVRGFITMSGQRGIYTAMNIDGASGKNAFFGYGRGGEATENDGVVVAQESVKEFQVVTSGFAPEYGSSGGGYINVVTKSGTNDLKGSAFFLTTDDSLKADIPASPLDKSRGDSTSTPVPEFSRDNYGLAIGGPFKKDKLHYYFAWDQTTRDEPFEENLRTRGVYDAILWLAANGFPEYATLIDGYVPNNDGIAAPDPNLGRTATGLFLRSVDNMVLFGKLDYQFNESHAGSLRVNYTDYERTSTWADEESLKLEETNSIVLSLVSVFGDNMVNEFRIQDGYDDLARQSERVGEPIEATLEFERDTRPPPSGGGDRAFSSRDSLGKFYFLPILADTTETHIADNFSYLFGNHDLKFGIDYKSDRMAQIFAGAKDGRYDFESMDQLLNLTADDVQIYFGNVTFPNYDEKQELIGIYGQDSWKPRANLTVNYGLRWQGTYNPDGLEHIFEVGEEIPDDTNNFAPRIGFAYQPGNSAKDVIRGGIGLFHGRTPTLLFASQIQENGIFPNFGRVTVRPGDPGFADIGQPIDNVNPPLDTIPSTSFFNPDFEDAETWRFNLGYERELTENWTAGADLVYADGSNLQRNADFNRSIAGYDQYGRVIYTGQFARPNPALDNVFVRESIGTSEYTAITLKAKRRYAGRYSLQAHYTWSEDKDDDSNERSATAITITDQSNPGYDFGFSERDVTNRFVLSGFVNLPWKFTVSGGLEYRSGTPWTVLDSADVHNYPFSGGPAARGILNGELQPRGGERSESVTLVNLRLSKLFEIGDYGIDLFFEAFNLFDSNSFAVVSSQREAGNSEFGIADGQVTDQQQFQLGVRLTMN